jgi:hypothetical protein
MMNDEEDSGMMIDEALHLIWLTDTMPIFRAAPQLLKTFPDSHFSHPKVSLERAVELTSYTVDDRFAFIFGYQIVCKLNYGLALWTFEPISSNRSMGRLSVHDLRQQSQGFSQGWFPR